MTHTGAQPDRSWIGEPFRESVTTQSYGDRTTIDGVRVMELTVFSDEGGDFCEITRLNLDGSLLHVPGYHPAQISYSLMEPGAIKAWHLHEHQDDLWFVPPQGRLLVGLVDVRRESSTYEAVMRLALGVGTARLLLIPRGVAHGVANLVTRPASLIYFSNTSFDPANPDEHRMPHDLLGTEFWTIRPG